MRSFAVCNIVGLVLLLLVGSEPVAAQSRGWFGQGDSPVNLLQNEKVREELELVEDQMNELETLRNEAYQEMRDMWKGMRDLSREERREKFESMRGQMEEYRGVLEERVNEVLLPHQQKRLSQLSIQSEARREGGAINFAASDKLAEKLNLTDEQKEKLKKAAEAAQKEMEEKIKKLRAKAEEKVLSVLTSEQREQYQELMGESFKFEDRNRWGGRDRSARRSGEDTRAGRGD